MLIITAAASRRKTVKALRKAGVLVALVTGTGLAAPAWSAPERFSVLMGERTVGHVVVDGSDTQKTISYAISDNGRGISLTETLRIDPTGLPVDWNITGKTTYGGKAGEHFTHSGERATWSDSLGKHSIRHKGPSIYVPQAHSPWSDGLYARALLAAPGRQLPILSGGTLRIDKADTLTVTGAAGPIEVTRYALVGLDVIPQTILLDSAGQLFGWFGPDSIVLREGYEAEEPRFRKLFTQWTIARLADIERKVAHRYATPVRIRNVRLFDPESSTLTEPRSVVVSGDRIAAVEAVDSPPTPGETTIDGAGGTLVPGMFDMHAHLQANEALLYIAAGVTTVRDMGNRDDVLDALLADIRSGMIAGPDVVRSGLVEGKSQYSESGGGIVVSSQEEALDAIRWYGARGYWQIKIYNSIHPDWVPAMTTETHRLGMRVDGHVPAFATIDQMITNGYDEITHANMPFFSWIQQPGDDTRTIFRVNGLKRFPTVDLTSPKVTRTLDLMASRNIAIDPTLGIHEMLTTNRDGKIPAGDVDYFDHMPPGWQRSELKALVDLSKPGDDQLYRAAWDKILDSIRLMNDRGILILFGTDTGGSFTYHHELEIYGKAGLSAAKILKRATYDSARYMQLDQNKGTIAKGKLADFYLIPGNPVTDIKAIKTISMVMKSGTVYFPSEIYPYFSIKPFLPVPGVKPAS